MISRLWKIEPKKNFTYLQNWGTKHVILSNFSFFMRNKFKKFLLPAQILYIYTEDPA